MAQPDDVSAAITPRSLIAVTVMLFGIRLTLQLVEFMSPPPALASVKWQDSATCKIDPESVKKKRILYEFYADWSDPCKKMEAEALSNSQIKGLIESNFIPIRVKDEQAEKGKNPQYIIDLQKKYRIFAFPTFVVVGPDGESESILVGNCSSLTTYRFLSRVLSNAGSKSRTRTPEHN